MRSLATWGLALSAVTLLATTADAAVIDVKYSAYVTFNTPTLDTTKMFGLSLPEGDPPQPNGVTPPNLTAYNERDFYLQALQTQGGGYFTVTYDTGAGSVSDAIGANYGLGTLATNSLSPIAGPGGLERIFSNIDLNLFLSSSFIGINQKNLRLGFTPVTTETAQQSVALFTTAPGQVSQMEASAFTGLVRDSLGRLGKLSFDIKANRFDAPSTLPSLDDSGIVGSSATADNIITYTLLNSDGSLGNSVSFSLFVLGYSVEPSLTVPTNPSDVPLPAALPLLFAGITAMAGSARLKMRRAA